MELVPCSRVNGRAKIIDMKTYTFNVIVEPDEARWHAYCPALESQGAATWGYTREEALKHIDEVVRLVI
jgi:predicted RNase H-like HicB family nuclease